MNYFVVRSDKEYGPYSLADLQRYIASGDLQPTDLARSEGAPELLAVSAIIGTIPAASAYAPATAAPMLRQYPDPPNLHWGLVLLFGVLSFGIFSIVWDILQSAWMKKIAPQSKSIYYYSVAAVFLLFIFGAGYAAGASHQRSSPAVGLLQLVYGILLLVGRFSLRSSLEQHFNTEEPMGLTLSGIMTFFFGGIYFQYHLNDIVKRKRAMGLSL